jgi:choline dehydrogenase-like flavoprotein
LEAAGWPGSTLRIVLNAPVQQLVANADRSRVEHVEAAAPDGRRIKVTADVFVLSAGAIQTARLLLNSRNDGSTGLGDTYGNVGRYFMTHPRTDIGTVILKRPVRTAHPLFRTEHQGPSQLRYCIGFNGAAQASHRLLNHHLQLLPLLEHKVVRLFERVKRNKVTHTRAFDRRSRVRGILPGIALASYRFMERCTSVQRFGRVFVLRGFLDQYPNPENRIALSDATDCMGERQAAIHWRFSQQDRESVLAFLDELSRDFAERGLGEVDYTAFKQSDDWPMLGIHSHFMGATRMGSSPTEAVTDKHGQLFETSNLYIAGPSLFPTSGSVNPFLTIAALSLRLADHIKARLIAKSKVSSSCQKP